MQVQFLKNVEGPGQWVHIEPGDPPYRYCRYAVAEPATVGTWADKLLDIRQASVVDPWPDLTK